MIKKSNLLTAAVVCIALLSASLATAQCPALGSGKPVSIYNPAGIYLDLLLTSDIGNSASIQFDSNGIPMVLVNGTLVYNPVTISEWGLQQYSYYIQNGTTSGLANLMKTADWLLANQDPSTGAWFYTFDFEVGAMGVTMKAPWSSAMTQGLAMSVLTRAYRNTNASKYLTAAQSGLAPMEKLVANGGVTDNFLGNPNLPHYEEYPTTPPSFTLNGFMYSLFGLYDLSLFNSQALTMYQNGMRTLDAELPYHDMGMISAYHLGHITNPPRPPHVAWNYHDEHIQQLSGLLYLNPSDKMVGFYFAQWCSYKPLTDVLTLSAVTPTTTTFGQEISLLAATDPSFATGYASLTDSGTFVLKSLLVNGEAQINQARVPAGTHVYQVVLPKDLNFPSATSNTVTIQMNPAPTSTALVSSANPSKAGTNVTFTATITPSTLVGVAATGTVQFYDGTTLIGAGTLGKGGATFSSSQLAQGTHSITASYAGDGNFAASTSSVLSQVIQ